MTADEASARQQPLWFLFLLALAVAGGAVSYMPFLTVLLPVRINALTGTDDVAALSYATFAGAIVASLANILFGWLSDLSGSRRGWILAGLVISGAMLISMTRAETLGELIAFLMVWQLGLNMMLGPLSAWAGDCVPDRQKGLLGGFFAFAPALGALSGAFITIPGIADTQGRLWLIALIVAALVIPALVMGKGRAMPHLVRPRMADEADKPDSLRKRSVVVNMWVARLLVQIAEAALFAFLLFWLRSLSPDFSENKAANLFSLAVCIAVPVALITGKWSDKASRPLLPLAAAAAISATGLLAMAFSQSIPLALAGYVLFGVASMTFLSLHSSQTLRVLPKPQHRGRDLGLFNLTNTLPSLIIPGLVISLVPGLGFSVLFMVLAALGVLASVLIAVFSKPI